jgi:hypothetical protein
VFRKHCCARYFASLFINSGLDEISRAVSMVVVDSLAHSTIPLGWGSGSASVLAGNSRAGKKRRTLLGNVQNSQFLMTGADGVRFLVGE